jgi:hypothetical protein
MSSHHPPTIDLNALQDSLADPIPPPAGGDAAALAIETAVNGNGHALAAQRNGVELPVDPEGSPPVPRLGAEAAANMTKLSKAAAEDIRQLGLLAFEAGKRVQEECEQMARDVEANGGTVALHLTGLSQLLADVGMSNRETLRRLLGGVSPSIVPPAGNGQAPEQPAGAPKAVRPPAFIKAGRRTE